MTLSWKPDLELAKQHHLAWWKHEGLVLMSHTLPRRTCREAFAEPETAPNPNFFYTQPAWRARAIHHNLACSEYPADTLPYAQVDTGPGSLSLYLGCEPAFSWETVWFKPILLGDQPEQYGPIRFNPESDWWKLAEEVLRLTTHMGRGKYLTGCPDLVENIDILAAMRDPQTLLIDMVDRPAWVEEKVWEINQAFYEVYDRVYELIKDEDGGVVFGAFHLWGPGKTAKVQCDTCAMFSPRMFNRFVTPALTAQCEWLDYSMFHLDGHQCLPHLDLLLDIAALDAIEWTPDPQVPSGGNACWHPLYRKILAAGKSVQAIGVHPDEVEPLLDATGGKGMYIMTDLTDPVTAERLMKAAGF